MAEGSLHRDEMHHAAAAAGTSTSQRPARGAHHVTSMELTTALGVGWSSGAWRMGEEARSSAADRAENDKEIECNP